MANCPNCGAEIKSGFFSSNLLYNPGVTDFIHEFTSSTAAAYCEKCGRPLIEEAKNKAVTQNTQNKQALNENIHHIPLLSLPAPPNWSFKPLALVTAQSVTGTGVFAEFASNWTDFFGAQSQTYNRKIAGGEQICQTQLRLKCVEMGGNAILGVDIDYAELGGDKGMIMVCMTGTAVVLENTEVLDPSALGAMQKLTATAAGNRLLKRYAAIINNANTALDNLTVPLAS